MIKFKFQIYSLGQDLSRNWLELTVSPNSQMARVQCMKGRPGQLKPYLQILFLRSSGGRCYNSFCLKSTFPEVKQPNRPF